MPAIDFHSIIGYNILVLQNTTSTRPIHFHLQASTAKPTCRAVLLDLPTKPIDRSAYLYSVLDNGWLRVMYRKSDGTQTSRLCTRNLTLVASLGDKRDISAIKNSEFSQTALETIVYYDYCAGSIRAFRVDRVDYCGIDATCATVNH